MSGDFALEPSQRLSTTIKLLLLLILTKEFYLTVKASLL